jgi:carboxymethylenebutenolidase
MPTSLQFTSGGVSIRMHAEEVALPGTNSPQPRPALLLLHGSGGHVDFWTDRLGPVLKGSGIGLYAPHYFDRTRTVRADLATITDGRHVPQWLETIDAALTFAASRPGVDPDRIVLAGVSLGGFLALSLAAQFSARPETQGRRRICALMDVSGGLVPPYDALATERMPPTLIVHGATDTIVPVSFAQELDRRLTALGVPHRTEILPDEGHWFSPAAAPRILLAASSFLEPYLR